MNEKIKIEKVEIKIAGKILSLTIAQALELRDILADTFPKATLVHHISKSFPDFVVIPSLVYIEQGPRFPTPHWEVWCKDSSSGIPQAKTMCLAVSN